MPATNLTEVSDLYARWGSVRYDEEVTQLDHALQTAALARRAGAGDNLVAAALLHDVGHLLELRDGGPQDGDVEADLGHEGRGARWLAGVFPPSVTGPIALHVAAKRFRCHLDPSYHDALSAGSRRSLVRQGGPMTAVEAQRFAAHPAHADAVRLREWDDGGKVEDLAVANFASYQTLLEQHLR